MYSIKKNTQLFHLRMCISAMNMFTFIFSSPSPSMLQGHPTIVLTVAINDIQEMCLVFKFNSRSQQLRGLRRRSTAALLLRFWVRIPLGAWTYICCECCVLSGRGLCEELMTRPEKSYRLWRVVVCDLETSKEEAKSPLKGCEQKPTKGCDAERKKLSSIIID